VRALFDAIQQAFKPLADLAALSLMDDDAGVLVTLFEPPIAGRVLPNVINGVPVYWALNNKPDRIYRGTADARD
jgi:hypothetical protein